MSRLVPGWVRALCGMLCAVGKLAVYLAPWWWSIKDTATPRSMAFGLAGSALAMIVLPWHDGRRLSARGARTVLYRNGGRCARWACTRKATQRDHCWPYRWGCPTVPFLMRPLCADHNLRKSDHVGPAAVVAQWRVGASRAKGFARLAVLAGGSFAAAYIALHK